MARGTPDSRWDLSGVYGTAALDHCQRTAPTQWLSKGWRGGGGRILNVACRGVIIAGFWLTSTKNAIKIESGGWLVKSNNLNLWRGA